MNDLDVKEIREKSGLTQEELAERMGVSTTHVDYLYITRTMYQIGDFLGA